LRVRRSIAAIVTIAPAIFGTFVAAVDRASRHLPEWLSCGRTRRNLKRPHALHRAVDGYDEFIVISLASCAPKLARRPESLAMSQAIVDPAELRRFANNLKKFNQELEERMTSLRGQLQALGTTWRDQEHKKFTDDFEHQMQVITKFVEATNEHTPFLLRKAERIEEYLQQR